MLPIQGPPGTGKTYVTARAILSLVAAGRRVAVASTSHEAIRNVLLGCLAALPDDATGLTIENVELAHKLGAGDEPLCRRLPGRTRAAANDDRALADADVVGGTAFLLLRPEFEGAFDTLFVDEAGQVGLANLLAMGRCARNIVLVGDPRQLPQVMQGAHPGAAGLSCLDWLLGDHATVPPDRGILLPVDAADASRPLPLRLGAGLRGPADEPPRHRPPARRRHPLAGDRRASGRGAA